MRINNRLVRIIADPILAPLPDVSVHVVQAPWVRRKTAYRRCLTSVYALLPLAVGEIAVVIRLVRRDRFATIKGRHRPGTAGVFPFRLGGQAVRPLVLPPQFFDELLAVIPRNSFDRQIILA